MAAIRLRLPDDRERPGVQQPGERDINSSPSSESMSSRLDITPPCTILSMSNLLDIGLSVWTVLIMNLLDHPLALFYDAARARVLDALLSSPEAMSGRKIARETNLSPTTVNGALGDLEERGFVKFQRKGRANLWSLQSDNKLIEQIRLFARVQDEVAGEVVTQALGSEPVSITLFGSTARGESGADSDLDLLIVSRDRAQDVLFRRKAFAAEKALRPFVGRPVEVTVLREDNLSLDKVSGFVREVIRDGRTLRGSNIEELVS